MGLFVGILSAIALGNGQGQSLADRFRDPPDDARPGVYWYFMDGNLNRREMEKDLESMRDAGIGNLVFLEVDVGVPRGPVKFMSDAWQDLFANAIHTAERLGIDVTVGAGPGWCGSGGPWVRPEQSMQHLVFSATEANGPAKFDGVLPVPEQRSTEWHTMRSPYYKDVAVFAFPKCDPVIADINEKALYERKPYSSMPGVKPYLPAPATFPSLGAKAIDPSKIVDLTSRMQPAGRLEWDVPPGEWTILRMGNRSTGASTRPAPAPGVGFEHDKFNPVALDEHFRHYYAKLLSKVGPRAERHGWTAVHLDSWEMGAQNWTPKFREEFLKRRGYDPTPFFPTFSGRAVGSVAIAERFLWDVRLTAQELVLENYAGHLKRLGREHGFALSIEPYDMNPSSDLDLGAVADVPMCEFWSAGMGFDSSFSCIEAASVAHTMGRPIVSAEAFTANPGESWQQYPWSMKNQGDWAFCMGINRFVFHTFAHQPLGEGVLPGMTMGPYGVHWDRNQTWWPMVGAYHKYVTRCSSMLRQGAIVSDVLYLASEGAPHVFRPPVSALNGTGPLADKKGYGFDGCSPNVLIAHAKVRDGQIVFPGGSSYRLLVLPRVETMTPGLLKKIAELVDAGATVIGAPPSASPSLVGYPECDVEVKSLARKLWQQKRVLRDKVPLPIASEKPLLPGTGQWIWLDEGHPADATAPGGVRFRFSWSIADLASVVKARLEATADNSLTLKVNGKPVLSGDDFHLVATADILAALRPGTNAISVVATNDGPGSNPAGLIAALRLTRADGTEEVINSDERWEASRDGMNWSPAKVLGSGGMAPWNLVGSSTPLPDLYPPYDATAAILAGMSIPPDFESDNPVRHGHRRTVDEDVYFVSNTTDHKVTAKCAFRIRSRAPQIWDPVPGEIRPLPQFTRNGRTISIPLAFEPYQSYFVVFPRKAVETRVKGPNFPQPTPVAILTGPWDVGFDPKWGGPRRVVFNQLQDWTTSADRRVKYYSGIATYRKRFDCPNRMKGRTFLDLGTVHDIARVRLNGKNLGVVWCAPWRVETTGWVKAKGNRLEIDVANRWANRMLGDTETPDKDVRTVKWDAGYLGGQEYKTGRYTFSTAGGLGKLLPSGLLGPVRIVGQIGR